MPKSADIYGSGGYFEIYSMEEGIISWWPEEESYVWEYYMVDKKVDIDGFFDVYATMNGGTDERICRASDVVMNKDVIIDKNDEAGVIQWSVSYADKPGDWINSFPTKSEAIDFARENKMNVKKVIEYD